MSCWQCQTASSGSYCPNCKKVRGSEYTRKRTPVPRYKRQVSAQQRRKRGSLTPDQWLAILEQSGGLCHYCHKNIGIDKLEIEHVIPLDAGGPNSASNVMPACKRCNRRKSTKQGQSVFQITVESLGDDEATIKSGKAKIRLFTSQIPDLIAELLKLTS